MTFGVVVESYEGQHRRDWRISMSKLKLNIAMSLDGYVAGPDQTLGASARDRR
jgi:hypothetical protein